MRVSSLLAGGILCTGILFAADPWAGVWKLRTTPRSTLASRTLTIVAMRPNAYLATFDDVSKTGEKTHREQSEICDGKEHQTDSAGQVEVCQPLGPSTLNVTIKVNGKITIQVTRAITPDGKVQTVSDGKGVTTYDRQ